MRRAHRKSDAFPHTPFSRRKRVHMVSGISDDGELLPAPLLLPSCRQAAVAPPNAPSPPTTPGGLHPLSGGGGSPFSLEGSTPAAREPRRHLCPLTQASHLRKPHFAEKSPSSH